MNRDKDRGQSAIELAMLLPLLLLITLGCIDLGRAFSVRMALANGAREGARYASMAINADIDELEAYVKQDILAEGLSEDSDSLWIDVEIVEDGRPGSPVRVTAAYTLPLLTTFLFNGTPVVIRAAAEMPIMGG